MNAAPTDSPASAASRGERNRAFALCAVLAVAAWILAGALFKLLYGSPNDLPAILRELPLSIDLVYKLAIAIELALVGLALLKPRYAWPLLALTLLVFDAILLQQIASGATSCGCFGSKLTISPKRMLLIDSTLLAALLVSRPWSGLRARGAPLALVLPVCALLAALPWGLDRRVDTIAPVRPDPSTPAAAHSRGLPAGEGPSSLLASYAVLEPKSWIGRDIWDTQLSKWIDVETLALDGTWVLYRRTCDHCATHLERMSREDHGERPIVLVRIVETRDNDQNQLVHVLPQGAHVMHAELPASIDFVVTTPVVLELEGGVVRSAEENPPE